MPTPLVLPSFAAGELSPALHGRVDLAKYHVGLATCLNWYIHPFGGASTRAGTSFVGEALSHSARSRLVPFQFSSVQTYVLEFGHLQMRPIMNGGYVLEATKAVTGITNALPAVITCVGHGYTTNDYVWIDNVVGMVQVNRRRSRVTVIDADHFQIDLDTTAYTAYSSGGTVARFYTVTTPYAASDLSLLKFVQSADTLTITHPSYGAQRLTRTAHTSWTLTGITFQPSQAAPTALVSSAPGATYAYVITAVNDQTGEESRVSTPVGSATQTSTLTWTDAAGASTYNVYKSLNGVYGFIGMAGSGVGGFTDATYVPNVANTIPQARNPFAYTNDYPGCSTYHDGRQWFARTNNNPQTIWATQSASFNNMDVSTPSQDSDAIQRTVASRKVDDIRFLLSFDVLLLFTGGTIWRAWGGALDEVMTPANTSLKPICYEGSAHVEPIPMIDSVLFVPPSTRKVRELSGNGREYISRDMSILSQHLFDGHALQEWAYAKDPDSLIWCVRDDGVLLCFTYLKEHDVYAWSRHTTSGTVESVAAIQENNATALYISVVRTIGGTTKRYVERMETRFDAATGDPWCLDSGYSYDGRNYDSSKYLTITGATYGKGDTVTLTATGHTPFSAASVGQKYILRYNEQEMVTVTVTAYSTSSSVSATLDWEPPTDLRARPVSVWALAITSLSGLWHLEGRTVSVVGDNNVFADVVVSNGTITLERACGRVVAGLGYTCDLETLDIEIGQPTLQGRRKVVSEVTLRVKDTRGLSVGPDNARLVTMKERTTEIMGYQTAYTTGDERITIDPYWNSNGRIFIRQSNPLPATVVAIIPRIDAGA